MFKTKKFYVAICSAFVLFLVACGGEIDPSPNAGVAPTVPDEDVIAAGGTVTVWTWDPNFNIAAMLEAERIYQQINPNFVLDVQEVPWDDIQTRLVTIGMAGALGELPDIVLIQDNAFQKNVIDFPDMFIDITNSGVDFDLFASGKVSYSVVNGHNFGVPFDNGVTIMALRTDILEQAGLSMSDFEGITWERFIELGAIVLEQTGIPMVSDNTLEPDILSAMIKSAGVGYFQPDGSPYIVDNAVLQEAIEVILAMDSANIFFWINNWDEYISSIVHGQVASVINGAWIMASIQQAQDQHGNWGITAMPRLSNAPGATHYGVAGGSSWAIMNNGNDPSLAIDFLNHTFAGSVELYENILHSTGALATFLPAADSEVYREPHPFFGGQAVFADITRFAAGVPDFSPGVFYYEARQAIGFAMQRIIGGMPTDQALQEAEAELLFHMN